MELHGSSVGIFWMIGEQRVTLLSRLCACGDAEPYGEFMTHGGHFEYWETLRALGGVELRRRGLPLAPLWSEYEEWPRGRVVLHVPTQSFVVYLDDKLRKPGLLADIVSCFGLPDGRFNLSRDAHYVSVRELASR